MSRNDMPGACRSPRNRIEHTRKREVIKTADWVLDLGPEGGNKGGEIVAEAEHDGRSGGLFSAGKPE